MRLIRGLTPERAMPEPKPAQGHTPGPWKADDNDGCRAIRGGKSGTHKQAQYYEVACTVGLNNEAEDEANARLIAAAPDLLAALQAIMAGPASSVKQGDWPVWDNARAAIAKATNGGKL